MIRDVIKNCEQTVKHAIYKFIGKDGSMGLRQGRRYNLFVRELNLIERIFSAYPYKWKVIAYRPYAPNSVIMPYISIDRSEEHTSELQSR